jgi:capsular polysaccharide transport system permease protein
MWKSLKQRFSWFDRLFFLSVVIPTTLAIVYYGFMASDIYVSESRIVVRSPERQAAPSASGLGSLLQGAGFARASEDSYTVQDFIQSRDALRVLNERVGLRENYASKDVDIVSRFAGLDPDDSFEALHEYYKKMVKVQTDSASSISTVSVRAFSAKAAQDANRVLLEKSEELVNRLNERGRGDLIRYALAEVQQAEAKAKEASLALSAYRNTESVLDPVSQATTQLQQVAKLQDELIATSVQLAQLRSSAPRNPQIPALVSRAQTLRQEMAKETAKATGGQKSLANKAGEFQRLSLEAEFANKQLGSALASLESARNEAQRQQVYLERIAQPSLSDVAQEPHRVRNILATLALGLVAWGILSMLIAGVKEHRD